MFSQLGKKLLDHFHLEGFSIFNLPAVKRDGRLLKSFITMATTNGVGRVPLLKHVCRSFCNE